MVFIVDSQEIIHCNFMAYTIANASYMVDFVIDKFLIIFRPFKSDKLTTLGLV